MSEEAGVTIPITAEDDFSSVFNDFVEQSTEITSSVGEITNSTEGLSSASESMTGSMEQSTSSMQDYSSSAQNVVTTNSEMSSSQEEAGATAQESGATFSETSGQVAGIAGTMGMASMAAMGLNDAYTRAQDSSLRLASATTNLAKAHETLTYDQQKLTEAQAKLQALVDAGITSGTKYTAAQNAVASAQKTVDGATMSLSNSQNTYTAAQNRVTLANEQIQRQWLMMGTSVIPMLITQLPQMGSMLGGVKDALTGASTAQDAMNAAILEDGGATDEEITSMLGLSAAEDETAISTDALMVSQDAEEGSTGIATAAQWLWNAALDANPIGLVVLAIIALVAIIGIATGGFKNWTPIINLVNTAFTDLKTVGTDLYNFFVQMFETEIKVWSTALTDLWNVIQPIVKGIEDISGGISKVTGAASSIGGGAVSSVTGAISGGISALTHLASGGIVTEPTPALIGESGPEAVIPLADVSTQSVLSPVMPNVNLTPGAGSQTSSAQPTQSTFNQTVNFDVANIDATSAYDWQQSVQKQLVKAASAVQSTV